MSVRPDFTARRLQPRYSIAPDGLCYMRARGTASTWGAEEAYSLQNRARPHTRRRSLRGRRAGRAPAAVDFEGFALARHKCSTRCSHG